MFASPIKRTGEASRTLSIQPLSREEYMRLHPNPGAVPEQRSKRVETLNSSPPIPRESMGRAQPPGYVDKRDDLLERASVSSSVLNRFIKDEPKKEPTLVKQPTEELARTVPRMPPDARNTNHGILDGFKKPGEFRDTELTPPESPQNYRKSYLRPEGLTPRNFTSREPYSTKRESPEDPNIKEYIRNIADENDELHWKNTQILKATAAQATMAQFLLGVEVTRLVGIIKNYETTTRTLKGDISALEDTVAAYQTQLPTFRGHEQNRPIVPYDQLAEENSLLKQQVADMKREIGDLEKELHTAAGNDVLAKQLATKSAEVSQLKHDIESLMRTIPKLSGEIQEAFYFKQGYRGPYDRELSNVRNIAERFKPNESRGLSNSTYRQLPDYSASIVELGSAMEDVIRKLLLASPSPGNYMPSQPNTATKTVYIPAENSSPEPKRYIVQQSLPPANTGTPPRMSLTRQVGDWQESERTEMVNGVPTRVKVRTRMSETVSSPNKDQLATTATVPNHFNSPSFVLPPQQTITNPFPQQPISPPPQQPQNPLAQSAPPAQTQTQPAAATKAELEALKAQNQQLQTKLEKALGELANRDLSRPDLVKLNRVYDELTHTVDALRSEVFDLKAALQHGVAELDHTKALLRASLDEEQRLRAELRDKTKEADKLKIRAEDAENELRPIKQKLAELQSIVDPLTKERDRLAEELAVTKDKLTKLMIQHTKLGQECEERIRELLARLESKQNSPKAPMMAQPSSQSLEEIKRLKSDLAQMQDLVEKLSQENKSLKDILSQLQNTSDRISPRVVELEQENRSLKNQIDQQKAQLQDAQNALSDLEHAEKVKPQAANSDELLRRIEDLEKNEADLIDDLVNTKAALKDAEVNRLDPQQVQNSLVPLLNQVRTLRDELDSVRRAEETVYRGTSTYLNSLKGIIRDKVDLVPKGTVASMIRRIRERDEEINRLGGRPLSSNRKSEREPSNPRNKEYARGWGTNSSRNFNSDRYKENEPSTVNLGTDSFDSFGGARNPRETQKRSTSRPDKSPGILKHPVRPARGELQERESDDFEIINAYISPQDDGSYSVKAVNRTNPPRPR